MGLNALPRYRLLEDPTPFQLLERLGRETGHPALYIKRDDAMPLGLGGNKLRSLEYWLGAAFAEGADTLVVAGHTASNQCRLTAAAAARAGLGCVVLHNADRPERIDGNLRLSHLYGAEISYLGPVGEHARREAAEAKVEALRREGRKPYLVGDPVLGAAGYVHAGEELLAQARAAGVALRHILLPGSMGPTEAGFLHGLIRGGFDGTAHLVSVEYDVAELEGRVARIFAGLEELAGSAGRPVGTIARFTDRYLGPGYGIPGPDAIAAIRLFAGTEALLLEQTYTAKPAAALLSMLADGGIAPDEPVCLLHTGGTASLFEDDFFHAVLAPAD
ncbi:pyridoxal-phosphate dependent enzyme [Nisaea sp.]|uniref:pyridoxal-phosphate dependent enzyme n=1 Tax=Nisaea sp. TaxID=2024842 RepID=UPI003B524DBE